VPSALDRLRELPPELRNAGIAAAALALSLLLPWYERSVPVGGTFAQRNVSAFGVFTFVEAAVLLVAAGVLFLVWARSEKKGFHLPGGDGTAIALAGGWAMLLLIWRLFDKPDARTGGDYGLQWGIVVALAAAGALLAAGLRVRAAHRPEPPNPAADDAAPPPSRPPRRRADPAAVTEVLGERPDWTGEPPEAPRRAPRAGETPDWSGEPPEAPRGDEAPTRRLGDGDEAPTRRGDDDRLF
jgi:hypothetical protein